MANTVGSSYDYMIKNLPKGNISNDGVLDLTKKFLFTSYYNSYEAHSEIPKGMYTNSVEELIKTIKFPRDFKIYKPESGKGQTNLKYTGVREFNVPEGADIISFVNLVIGIDVSTLINKLKNEKGPLKYSELIPVLKLTKNKIEDILVYYKSVSWLNDYIAEMEKEIIVDKETIQIYDIKNDQITIEVLKSLLVLILKGYLFNINWFFESKDDSSDTKSDATLKPICLYEIDSEYKILITYEVDGDTYKIKLDDSLLYNTIAIPMPKEATDAFLKLFNNSQILVNILEKVTKKMDEDKERDKKLTAEELKAKARLASIKPKQPVVSVIDDPRIQQAIKRKKHYESNGTYRMCPKLSVEPLFLLAHFDEIKELGLLRYFDLSKLDTSHLTLSGIDLSYSNIKVVLRSCMDLKNTNLTGVNLFGQTITD